MHSEYKNKDIHVKHACAPNSCLYPSHQPCGTQPGPQSPHTVRTETHSTLFLPPCSEALELSSHGYHLNHGMIEKPLIPSQAFL